MLNGRLIKLMVCLLSIVMLSGIGLTEAKDVKVIEPKLIMEYKFDEPVVDVIFDEATMTVKEARALGVKGLEKRKATEIVKVQYPKVVMIKDEEKSSLYYQPVVKAIRFLDEKGRVKTFKLLRKNSVAQISLNQKYIGVSSRFFVKEKGKEIDINEFYLINEDGKILWKLREEYPLELGEREWSRCGQFCISNTGRVVDVFLYDDEKIDFYDINGKIIKQVKYTDRMLDEFASCWGKFSEDGEYFVLIGNNGVGWDKTFLVLYDKDGNELWKVIKDFPGWSYGQFDISKNGNYVIAAKTVEVSKYIGESWINVFNKEGKLLWEFNARQTGNFIFLFSYDEKLVLIGGSPNKLFLFTTNDGKLLWEFTDKSLNIGFASLDISPENKYILAIAKEGKVYLFDINGNLLWQKQYKKGVIARFTPDGRNFNIVFDNKVYQYSIQEGKPK